MSAALAAVCPATTLQTCIVHLRRHRFDVARARDRQPLGADALDALAASAWGTRVPTVVGRAWPHVVPCFACRRTCVG